MNELMNAIVSSANTVALLSPPPEINKLIFDDYPGLQDIYEDGYCEQENLSSAQKMLVSITHAIIIDQKLVFGMTRESFMKVVKMDCNWSDPVGETNGNYSKVLAMMQKLGVRRLTIGSNKKAGVMYIEAESLLSRYIEADFNEQLLAVWNFVKPLKASVVDLSFLKDHPELKFYPPNA